MDLSDFKAKERTKKKVLKKGKKGSFSVCSHKRFKKRKKGSFSVFSHKVRTRQSSERRCSVMESVVEEEAER